MKKITEHKIISRTLFFFFLFAYVGISSISSGQETINENVSPREISSQQLKQLESLGIDPSNPEAAIQRARDIGIPETEIQKALQEDRLKKLKTDALAGSPQSPEEEDVPSGEIEEPVEETFEPEEEQAQETGYYFGRGRWSGLRYYGYDIFDTAPESVGPIEIGPVDPGYPIGAGDVLRLVVWGEYEFQYELEVNREGNINIPQAGQVFVAGIRLENLRETLKNYLSKFYSGLAKEPPTTFMDLTLARLRTNQIYIMGEVKRPGVNSVSSYATAFNVMYAVGGPSITGSLRDVRILREGKIIAHIDMYDYILKGVSTDDRRLQHNDIVFVPPRGITVGIKGEVLRPGIYELTKSETLQDLINMAGGLEQTAYSFRVQIDRILPFEERQKGKVERELLDVNIDAVMKGKEKISLFNGDIVMIFPILDIMINYVDITGGGIVRPGRYELEDTIITLSDLVAEADGLTGDVYLQKADIIRTREDFTEEFIKVNLEDALHKIPDSDIKLQRWDRIYIYSKSELLEPPQITLGGFVKSPGIYLFYDNITLYDLLFKYSGLQDSLRLARTFTERGDIYRLRGDGKTRYTIPFNVQDVWDQKTEASIILQPEDEVFLYEKEVAEITTQTVFLHGEVKRPGEYRWEDNMRLTDLILKGGGFTPRAWFLEADVSRVPVKGIKGENISQTMKVKLFEGKEYPENPEDVINSILHGNNSMTSFKLEPNDHVFIRANPEYIPIQVVSITGEVFYPGDYSLQYKNETLSSVLNRVGGIKESAFLQGGQLIRDNERVFIDFSKIINRKDGKEDIVLLPGDRIIIPPRISTVLVTGEVFNPGYYKYIRNARAKEYLNQAGGRSENSGKVYLTEPTGRTHQLGFFRNPKVMEGSVITVQAKPPEEAKEIDWSETIIDSFSFLTGAMTIIYLADRITE